MKDREHQWRKIIRAITYEHSESFSSLRPLQGAGRGRREVKEEGSIGTAYMAQRIRKQVEIEKRKTKGTEI